MSSDGNNFRSALVIGYGNTLRGDDAAGVRVAEELAKRHPALRCLSVHQLTPELAHDIAEVDRVFFVDADAMADHVYAESVEQTPARIVRSHSLSPTSLLSLARDLYGHAPRQAHVIGIPAREFDLSEDLSPAARTGVAEAVECVGAMLERS